MPKKNKRCENCGSKVYDLGCVNCDEENYIEQQEWENELDDLGGTGHGDISMSDADPGL